MTPAQLRMARAAVKLGVRELAELAGVATYTISRFETEQGGLRQDTAQKLEAALAKLGVQLIPQNGGGPGVRLKRQGPPDEGLRPGELTSENDG
jgi:transcriptional regulator with XRE-family HTH domain